MNSDSEIVRLGIGLAPKRCSLIQYLHYPLLLKQMLV